jgi:putative transposase
MRLTYKYRLFPTAAQRTALNKALNACRWVYNKVLEARKEAWEQREENVSRYDAPSACFATINMLPKWKPDNPFLRGAFSQCLQEVCTRVDLAFQHFFRRVKTGDSASRVTGRHRRALRATSPTPIPNTALSS